MKRLRCLCCGKTIEAGDSALVVEPEQNYLNVGYTICEDCVKNNMKKITDSDLKDDEFMEQYGVDEEEDED